MTYITAAGYHNHDNQHCLRFSIAVIKDHDQEQVGKERTYFSFQFHCTGHYSGSSQKELKQGGDVEAGVDAEAMQE